MPLSATEATTLLEPYLPLVAQAIREAWARYCRMDPADRRSFEKRTRACIINDFMVERLRELTAGDPNVRAVPRHGHIRFAMVDKVVLRLKKFDRQLRARNILTRHAHAFVCQELPIAAELVGADTNLFAGYRLNELETAPEGFYVVCPSGPDNLAWHYQIPDAGVSAVVEITPTPGPEGPRPRRVLPKRPSGETAEGTGA